MQTPLYQQLAALAVAAHNCDKALNGDWAYKHRAAAGELTKRYLPSGSGFDSGTQIDMSNSSADKLTFRTSFHHMDEAGCYDGWTEHVVTVKPQLLSGGIILHVSGRNRNAIKDYIADTFDHALHQSRDWSDELQSIYRQYESQTETA